MHHNKHYERDFVNMMTSIGITCFRIAGSGAGEEAVSDCVLYLPEPCLVEVKATKEDQFYMRKNVREQLQKMITVCSQNNLIPILVIKFKYRGWNVLRLTTFENIHFIKERCVDETLSKDSVRALIGCENDQRNSAGHS